MKKMAFEDLKVWQKSIDFAVNVLNEVEEISSNRKHYRLIEQIEACSTSIAANLAEGKGRNSKKEFVQFCYIARGSAYETMTFIEIMHKKGWIPKKIYQELRNDVIEIASMIKGLINSIGKNVK